MIKKVGVDDYLLKHNDEELLNLAIEAPEQNKSPFPDSWLVRILEDMKVSRLTPRKAVEMVRDMSNVSQHMRRTLVSTVVITALTNCGRFIRSPQGRYYFHRIKKQLLELDSFEFSALLSDLFGLNQTEQEFKFSLADLHTEVYLRGEEAEVHHFAYYSSSTNVLYVDRFDGEMYRLNGENIRLVDNGTDGIVFIHHPEWKPYLFIEDSVHDIKRDELLAKTLVKDIPFEQDSFAPLTPDQQRMVFILWLYSLFFESILPTKPIMTFIGEKGSGKTTALRRILRLFFGPGSDVTGLERDREDAFIAAITHNYLAVFDNLDGKVSWINDRLAIAATGSSIQRRKLYTTNELVIYRPRCFLAVTSRNPQFKRDDIADRLILLKVDRLKSFIPESTLLKQVDSNRDLLLTEMLCDLNEILASLKKEVDTPKYQFRMSDWAALCWRIAAFLGVGNEFNTILSKLSVEQSTFVLGDDPLYICLTTWLENPDNINREVNSRTLYNELAAIAQTEQIEWTYTSAISLGKRLNNIKSNIAQLIPFHVRTDPRRRNFYKFHSDERVNDEVTR